MASNITCRRACVCPIEAASEGFVKGQGSDEFALQIYKLVSSQPSRNVSSDVELFILLVEWKGAVTA